ncbi:MAG: PhzF family phenazine biosynthesis protein [candidate division WOR-3 bacterium]|nr:MAG: PhzF family phenazine biosynthesis protein [candidate division WOR-3 bacterium]
MVDNREFVICDVFARDRFQGNQLAVFPDAAGLTDTEMQALAREMHFSETTFILADRPGEKGWPVRIFTPGCEVPFAGHPTLGTAWVIWDRFLGRKSSLVRLDLKVGTVPVAVEDKGERLVMTQVAPEFGDSATLSEAAGVLGLEPEDIDDRFPCQEVSTGLWFLVVPVRSLAAIQGIKVDLSAYYSLIERMKAKAVLAFCTETVDPDNDLHVRAFCDYYDVPEDPATGSANGCLCAWLVKHRFLGSSDVRVKTEQGVEMKRPSQLHLSGTETDAGIEVKVGGKVVLAGRGVIGQ